MSTQEIRLSDLKIAGLKLPHAKGRDPSDVTEGHFPPPQVPSGGSSPSIPLPKPYEKLSKDNPGEELAPDAGIWSVYMEEGKRHDEELTKARNVNLDVMLIFAGLFSALLSAFLVESKKLLEEDTGQLTATLLLAIAQSQQRIEQGKPQEVPNIERPAFNPSLSARCINGLWFTALFFALSAALIAMLAKEWLIAFNDGRTQSPKLYAHQHQERLSGLRKWLALDMIDLLPSVLHMSLMLFSLGLAVYLWTLDKGIAAVGIFILLQTYGFYWGTALLAAYFDSCPYKTQVSKYVGIAFDVILPDFLHPKNKNEPRNNFELEDDSMKDIQALRWLTKHPRDPRVGESACQALAGLLASRDKDSSLLRLDSTNQQGFFWRLFGLILHIRPLKTLAQKLSIAPYNGREAIDELFKLNCVLLSKASSNQRHILKACQGINVARYSCALPVLLQCLQTPTDSTQQNVEDAFKAIQTVWNDNCPRFLVDAYALLVSAELYLIEVVVRHAEFYQGRENSNPTDGHGVIDIGTAGSLGYIRTRYRETIARWVVLLKLHNEGHARISKHGILYLLDSMRIACERWGLTRSSQNTNAPQGLLGYEINLVDVDSTRTTLLSDPDPENGCLQVLMAFLSSLRIEATSEIQTKALKTLVVVGRHWIKQSMGATEPASEVGEIMTAWDEIHSQKMAEYKNHFTTARIDDLKMAEYEEKNTMAQMLCISTIAISQVQSQETPQLEGVADRCLHYMSKSELWPATITRTREDNLKKVLEMFRKTIGRKRALLSDKTLARCSPLLNT